MHKNDVYPSVWYMGSLCIRYFSVSPFCAPSNTIGGYWRHPRNTFLCVAYEMQTFHMCFAKYVGTAVDSSEIRQRGN